MTDRYAGLRTAVVAACHDLAGQGLVRGTSGNVSVRAGEHVAVTATGAAFATLTAEHVVVTDLAGRLVDGALAPTSELALHLGVHAERGPGAVVHTHGPAAVAVGLVTDELPCLHYELVRLGGTVRVAPYATFGTPELAEHVRAALDGRAAALMANHGAVTTGPDLAAAVAGAGLLEWACEVWLRAAAAGTPRTLGAAAHQAVVAAATARRYGSTRPATPSPEDAP